MAEVRQKGSEQWGTRQPSNKSWGCAGRAFANYPVLCCCYPSLGIMRVFWFRRTPFMSKKQVLVMMFVILWMCRCVDRGCYCSETPATHLSGPENKIGRVVRLSFLLVRFHSPCERSRLPRLHVILSHNNMSLPTNCPSFSFDARTSAPSMRFPYGEAAGHARRCIEDTRPHRGRNGVHQKVHETLACGKSSRTLLPDLSSICTQCTKSNTIW